MTKKIIALAAALSAVCLLAAGCGSSDSSSEPSSSKAPASDAASQEETVTVTEAGNDFVPSGDMTTLDTGVFSISAPDGWTAVNVPDTLKEYDGKVNPNGCYVIKGGTSAADMINCPYIWVVYYENGSRYSSSKGFYDNVKDLDPFELGGRTWKGFTFSSMDVPGASITAEDGGHLWVVNLSPERKDLSFSLEDEDVKAILSSIKLD